MPNIKKNKLIWNFSILSFIIILILGIVFNYTLSNKIEDVMITRAKDTTVLHAQEQVEKYLEPGFFSNPDFEKNKRIFEQYYSDVKSSEIIRVKIYNKDGTIIFSDEKELIGKRFQDNDELEEALEGNVEVEIKRDLSKEENVFEKKYGGLMEIYIPLYNDETNELIGVAELYQVLDNVDILISSIQKTVTILLVGGLAFLYISLIWVVKGASDTIVKINKDLSSSYEELKEIDEIKTEFMHSISHELRTPMNAIIGFSDLLLGKDITEISEKDKRYLVNINDSGKHLYSLINNILDMSEFKKDKTILKIEKTSLNESIQTILNVMGENAKKKNVTFNEKLDNNLDYIEVDAHKLNRILYIILENAVKFSNIEGGLVTISTSVENNMAKISIMDNGIGIEEEYKKKIFTNFTQADSSDTRKYGGLGLGLSLAKKLVELHDGTITFESEFGKGTTFNIFLPIERRPK